MGIAASIAACGPKMKESDLGCGLVVLLVGGKIAVSWKELTLGGAIPSSLDSP